MPVIKILAVDDEPVVGLSIKFALAPVGYTVDLAASPEEALQRFADGVYDVVITDFFMPHMTGLQLAEQLRARSSSVRIILLSGSPPFPLLPAIDLFLVKPFCVQELRDAIAHLVKAQDSAAPK